MKQRRQSQETFIEAGRRRSACLAALPPSPGRQRNFYCRLPSARRSADTGLRFWKD